MTSVNRSNVDAPTILAWLRTHPSPHARTATNLASLRSGVAIAEILAEKLPETFHSLFLPHIEIYKLNPRRAMLNLKVMLDTLKVYYAHSPDICLGLDQFGPEGLYFDHNMMETFLLTVIMPLGISSVPQANIRSPHQPLEEVTDIANLSSIIAHNEPKPTQEKPTRLPTRKATERAEQISIEQARIESICRWLSDCHRIKVEQLGPEEVMGRLVNSAFTGSRLDKQQVVKQSHYELGAVSVFKKVGDFLVTCERMPKQNVLAMMEQIQQGCMREQLFWSVIEDIMNIRASHGYKLQRRSSSSKKSLQRLATKSDVPSLKQNMVTANTELRRPVSRKPAVQTYQCSKQVLKQSEAWIVQDLGYEHSLNKSRNSTVLEQSPLLNGTLLGSIVMRLALGKVAINKRPRNMKEVEKNMSEVVNCIIRRGLEAGRQFSKFKPCYSTYLGIIWEVKCELDRKKALEKSKRVQQARQRRQNEKVLSSADKEGISEWLRGKGYEVDEMVEVPAELVSEVCGEVLELRLLRETTARIRENNMEKVMHELRRLGWEGEGGAAEALGEDQKELRWSMLKFGYDLVKFKIYYYR